MPRIRKSVKSTPRRSVKTKIQKPKAIENPQSEQLQRCMKWIKDQQQENYETTDSTTASEISENPDKVPSSTTSSEFEFLRNKESSKKKILSNIFPQDSLSVLRTLRSEDIKQSILYACEWKNCKQEFESDNELFDHVSSHLTTLKPENDQYNCFWDLCNFKTQCNSEISRHVHYHAYHTKLKTIGESISRLANIPRCTNDSKTRNTIPELKTNFVCRWSDCSRSFLSITLFCRHMRNHCISLYDELKSTKKRDFFIPCAWENCKMKFTAKYRLIEHTRKHTGEKIVGCYQCGALFKTNTIFLDHCKRQLQNNTQEYQCAQCFKYFASERLLRYHVLTHVNCFKCSLCDMTCSSAYGLARHVRYRHLSDRPIQCTNCDKRFVSKSDLEQHVQSVHKKKVFECGEPECNFAAKSLSALRRHDTVAHANNKIIYACHCCDNTYKSGTKLSKHLINSHKFQLPSGHTRFMYRMDGSGYYRLQTMRIESLEVTRQILSPRTSKADDYCIENNSCSADSYKQLNDSMTTSACITMQDNSTDQFVFEYHNFK